MSSWRHRPVFASPTERIPVAVVSGITTLVAIAGTIITIIPVSYTVAAEAINAPVVVPAVIGITIPISAHPLVMIVMHISVMAIVTVSPVVVVASVMMVVKRRVPIGIPQWIVVGIMGI